MIALPPIILGLLAISLYATLPALAKKMQMDMPPFALIGLTMFTLSLIAFSASFLVEKSFSFQSLPSSMWLKILLFSSINFIAFALYLAAIQRLPISEYQLTELIGPIVGAIAAYFILGEMVKPQHIWGLLIIGTGLFVALRNA